MSISDYRKRIEELLARPELNRKRLAEDLDGVIRAAVRHEREKLDREHAQRVNAILRDSERP